MFRVRVELLQRLERRPVRDSAPRRARVERRARNRRVRFAGDGCGNGDVAGEKSAQSSSCELGLDDDVAGRRQLDLARTAQQQWTADVRLQPSDLGRQGRLRQVRTRMTVTLPAAHGRAQGIFQRKFSGAEVLETTLKLGSFGQPVHVVAPPVGVQHGTSSTFEAIANCARQSHR